MLVLRYGIPALLIAERRGNEQGAIERWEGQAGASARTDLEPLRLYASDHNEAAFFSLVRRYGPMGWKLWCVESGTPA